MLFLKSILLCYIIYFAQAYTYKTQPLGIPTYDSMSKHLPLCKENAINTGQDVCRCTHEGQLEVYLIRPGQSCIHGKFSLTQSHISNTTDNTQLTTYSYKDQPLGIPAYNSSYPMCEENADIKEICQCTTCSHIEIYVIRPGQFCVNGNFSLSVETPTPCNSTDNDIQDVIDAINNCNKPCPDIPEDVQDVLDMIDECNKPCPDIPEDVQDVLDMIDECNKPCPDIPEDVQDVLDMIDECNKPCPDIPEDVQDVLDMIDECNKPCPGIPEDVQDVLDMIDGCNNCSRVSDDIQGVIDAINTCLPKYDPCENLWEHCSCLECDPKDSECAETKDIKSCQYDNNTLVCKTATAQTQQCDKYDPCENKDLDCFCNLCSPDDLSCVETAVVKTCQKEKNALVCKMGTSGKRCEACTKTCDLGFYLDEQACVCKTCDTAPVETQICQKKCDNFDCGIYTNLGSVYAYHENKYTCCDTRDCRDFDCRGLYRNTKQVSVNLTKDNCCQRNLPNVVITRIEAKQQEVLGIFTSMKDSDMEEFSTTITKAVEFDETSNNDKEQAPIINLKVFRFDEKRAAVVTSGEKKKFIVEETRKVKELLFEQVDALRTKEVVHFKLKDAPVSPEFKNELTKRNVSAIDVSTPKRKPADVTDVTCDDADVHLEKISKSGAFTVLLQHVGNSSVKCIGNTLATRMELVEKNTDDYNYYNVECYNNNTKQWETTHSRLKEEDQYTCPITGKYKGNVGSDSGAFAGCDSNFAPTNGNDGDCTELGIGESCQPGCDDGYISVGITTCAGNNEYSSITTCSQCSSPKTIINNKCVCPEGFDGNSCNYCAAGFAQGDVSFNEYCWKCDMNDSKKCNINGCVATISSLYTYQPDKNSNFCKRCKTCSSGLIPEGCGGISEGTGNCIEKDECNPNPCGSKSTKCTDVVAPGTGYTCECEPGWTGQNCEEDLKECDTGEHTCDASAICIEQSPGFKCECRAGFAGDGHTCQACSYPLYQELQNQTSCNTCSTCSQGLAISGCGDTSSGTCVDIDACTDNECSTTSTCVDTPAPGTGYTCDCEPGWLGERCNEDINQCLGDHGCDTNAICVDDTPGFHCECKAGYVGDNNTCTPCNSGDYQDVRNQTECKICPGGTGGTTGVSGAYQSCSDCGSGYGKKNGNCVPCQASSYQWDNSVDESPCNTHSKCPIGSGYKHVNKINACYTCNSTYEFNDIDWWSPCFTKKTKCQDTTKLLIKHPSRNTQDDTCSDCPAGHECDGTTVQIECKAGTFSNNGKCQQCPAGTYSTDTSNICINCGDDSKYSIKSASECLECPAGNYTSGGTAQTRDSCQICPIGHRCDGSSNKIECTDNNYAIKGQTTCSECPHGYWPDLTQSNCDWCDLGWGKNNSICEKCQEPLFSYTQSDKPCVAFSCPKGQGIITADKCQNCTQPAFSDSEETGICESISCPKGTFFKWTSTKIRPTCEPCPTNTYMDLVSHHETSCKPQTTCQSGFGGVATSTDNINCLLCPPDVSFSHNNLCWPVTNVYCDENEYYLPGTSTQNRMCKSCPENTSQSKTQHRYSSCDFVFVKLIADGPSGLSSALKDVFTSATSSNVVVSKSNGKYIIDISSSLLNGDTFPNLYYEHKTAIEMEFNNVEFDLSQSPCIIKIPQDGTVGDCPYILQPNETCQPSCKSGFTLYRGPVCTQAVTSEPLCVSDLEFDLLNGIITEQELAVIKSYNTNKGRFIATINNKTLDVQKRRRVFRYIFDYGNTPFDVAISQAQLHPNIQALMVSRKINHIKMIPPKYKNTIDCSNADIDIFNAPRAFEIPLQYEHETALICRKNTPITKMRLKSNKYMVSCFENNQWGAEFEKNSGDTYQCGTLEFFVNSLGSTTCNVKFMSLGIPPRQSLGNCPQTLVEGESCELGCNYFYQFVTGPSTCTDGVYSGAKCLISCHKIQHDWDHNCCGPRGHFCRALKGTFKQYGCCSHFIGTAQHSRY